MAEPANDDERRTYVREHISADLAFIFTEAEVPLLQQVRLGRIGYKTVRRFASWADDRWGGHWEGLWAWLA